MDKRTDLWAFGCLLLELLTGKPPFQGDTVPDTLAAVLEREPDLDAVPAVTPRAVVRVIRRCLRKDPGRRRRDIGDAALDLEEAGVEAPTGAAEPSRRAVSTGVWRALLTAVAIGSWFMGSRVERDPAGSPRRPSSLSVVLPQGVLLDQGELPGIAVSPGGRWIAFVGRDGESTRLFLRSLDGYRSDPVPETEGAISPFFSPGR